jgi:hypothetical protein
MDRDEPVPTYRSNWDRVTFLLSEWRWPLLVASLAVGVWVSWATPELPEPPGWLLGASASAGMLVLPLYGVFSRWAAYLDPGPPWVYVAVADAGTADSDTEEVGSYTMKKVLPQTWENRTETTHAAKQPAKGKADWVVTRWNYMEEIGELEVQGVDGDLPPGEVWQNADRVDTIFEHHQRVKRKYSQLKARVHDYATDVHDVSLMTELGEREDAELADDVSVTDRIEEMERDVDGLPETPARPQPAETVEEAVESVRPEDADPTGATATDGGRDR